MPTDATAKPAQLTNPADMATADGPAVLRIEPAGWLLPIVPGASLLEAAQAGGVRLPRSCRNGTCRACMCQLLSGTIAYRVDWPGLSAEEKQAGWILPCVASAPGPGCVTIDAPQAKRTDPRADTSLPSDNTA